ncbi:dihydropteroate synthase [Pseudooceanicola sp. C21-150M6]|uniref:dihydropteroate synthase n=1 Tax=Pseudooceanicola sp. C21-150M6 TaxID=3434355 RepID=UPI003D7F6C03
MSRWLRPIALPGSEGQGVPLAGQRHVRFGSTEFIAPGSRAPGPVVSALPGADRQRLTALRPALCGLTLDRPRIMGILNVTPDSFSDGGLHHGFDAAVAHARSLALQSDILDIGGESTRPGAAEVPVKEEIARTAPVICAIRDAGLTLPISIDTRKAAVAEAALDAGADMVNDVSALAYDPEMAALVAERGVPVCLMHSRRTPADMQSAAVYEDTLAEVLAELSARAGEAQAAGIAASRIIVDPGIGFAKTLVHNLELLRGLTALHDLGYPVLLGASRKRFIGTIGGAEEAAARMPGSLAVALQGVAQGMQILRVHDAAETAQAVRLWLAMTSPDGETG